MKALVWHGTTDIRCDSVPDPDDGFGRYIVENGQGIAGLPSLALLDLLPGACQPFRHDVQHHFLCLCDLSQRVQFVKADRRKLTARDFEPDRGKGTSRINLNRLPEKQCAIPGISTPSSRE
ncbi:hypothetical protein RX328_16860 [Bradyrhizobium sp. sBnM-33]|nr:hypothetical protein [Bradyrhizobium sp. sBnM-33]WOH53602.1 hypothetical protein RX328_16860 [Bradyrhizobium sp. sBnM-33]